jgi:hypothetical protein
MMGALLAGALAIWFLLTVLSQRKNALQARIAELDRFHLIPQWTFFAPNPGTYDFRLVVRVLDGDGESSPWNEVLPVARRGPFSGFWNPDRRIRKAIVDLTQRLVQTHPSLADPDAIVSSDVQTARQYRRLLACATNGHGDRTGRFQFMVVATTGIEMPEDPHVVFKSALHESAEPDHVAA